MDLSCHSREKVAATWTQFKEEVEKLFCEKYHMQCGTNYEEAAVLVAKFADLMEDGFVEAAKGVMNAQASKTTA